MRSQPYTSQESLGRKQQDTHAQPQGPSRSVASVKTAAAETSEIPIPPDRSLNTSMRGVSQVTTKLKKKKKHRQ